jgi:hypothetical protein
MLAGLSGRPPLPRLITLGLLLEAGFLCLGLPGLPVAARIAIQGALFAVYLAAVIRHGSDPLSGRELRIAIALAAGFRLTLLVLPPFYSDDLYRYIWDGRVQVEGRMNPYRHAPAAQPLEHLRDPLHSSINHPEIPTIYPPVSQILFAAVARVSPSVPGIKTALLLFDLGTLLLLRSTLARAGLPGGRLLIYAWSPLVVAEVAGNGHIDALAVFFLVAAIHLIITERSGLSTIALGVSAGAKFLGLLALPAIARRLPARLLPLPLFVLAGSYLPYAGAGSGLFRGLREYGERWQHNDALFTPILRIFEAIDPTAAVKTGIAWLQDLAGDPAWIPILYRYAHPVYFARAAAAALLAAAAVAVAVRRIEPVRGTFLMLATALLLSPTVHPWYLLWIVPLLALHPNRAWILLTGLVPLSYLDDAPMTGGVPGRPWVRWAEYAPFFALLILDALRSRIRRPL